MSKRKKPTNLEKSLQKFTQDAQTKEFLTETEYRKFQTTLFLLDDQLRFGGVMPRGPRTQRRKRQMGDVLDLGHIHEVSENTVVHLMSGKTSEDRAYNPDVDCPINYPSDSTYRDRHQIRRGLLAGFGRRSVLCTADMSACSVVTVRDFLIFALENCDSATFALIWLVVFVGVNHNRPILEIQQGFRHPVDDEILVDPERCVVVFNLIRRHQKDDDDSFEICGRMAVPVGLPITEGLLEIARLGTQDSSIAAALRGARRFTNRWPGLTPTLLRLLASNAIHMARLGLTELQSAALRGRVPPILFGVSAYYPHTVAEIVDAFKTVYHEALDRWCLPPALAFDLGDIRSIDDAPIYCPASRGVALVANVLDAIGANYLDQAHRFQASRVLRDPTTLLTALNTHEFGTYVLQEIGLGLRPVGDVAEASVAGRKHGALTWDKASRLFSERSYSPVSGVHEDVLMAREQNRAYAASALAHIGISLRWPERDSGLAMQFNFDPDSFTVIGRRIRGSDFREFASDLPSFLTGNEEQNWLRHVSAEQLGNQVSRWLSDEFHGHKIIGRQPFGPWSTVSFREFDHLMDALESLHEEVVPASLSIPISSMGSDRNF